MNTQGAAVETSAPTIDPSAAEIASVFDLSDFGSNAAAATAPAVDPEHVQVPAAPEPAVGVAPAPTAVEPAQQQAPSATLQEPVPQTPLPGLELPAAPLAPVAGAPDEMRLLVSSLQAQLAALQQQQQQAVQQQVVAPVAGGGSPDDDIQYALGIPQDLAAAIFSDDPATNMAGMTHLVNSLATTIHKRLRTEFTERMDTRFNALTEREQQSTVEQQRAAAKADYFAAFPSHSSPVLEPIVWDQAAKLAAEMPHVPWNADFMHALGARVNNLLASLQPASGAAAPLAAPAALATQAPNKPAAFLSPGPRSGIPSFETDKESLIENTFSVGYGG
jgi:hypothetical protein